MTLGALVTFDLELVITIVFVIFIILRNILSTTSNFDHAEL